MALSNMNVGAIPANAGGFTVGYNWNNVATDSSTFRITVAGKIAVLAALNTYWQGLTTPQKQQLDDNFYDLLGHGNLVMLSSQGLVAACVPGDGATVCASIATALNTGGNTVAI